jgi:HEAT repeat protein
VTKRFLFLSALLIFSAAPSRGESIYQPLLATSAGRDSLMQLAAWEDGRVTGGGKLFQYLSSKNALIRLRAVEVIGRIQDPQDVPRLLLMLKDPDARVVRESIFALGQMASKDAVPALVKFGKTATPGMKIVLAEALGKIAGTEAVAALAEMRHEFQGSVRRAGMMGLARAGDPAAGDALLIAVNDADATVAAASVYALEKVESKRVTQTLIKMLDHEDPIVRTYAARTLGRQTSEDGVDPLIKRLRDPDDRVVITALDGLARLLDDKKEKKAVEPVGKLLNSARSHHVRKAAVMTLGRIGHKDAKDYLAQTMLDEAPGIRAESCRAIAKTLGKNALVFLGSGLNDSDRAVRAAATEALGIVEEDKKVPELIEVARKDNEPMLRAAAVRALSNFDKDKVTPTLIEKLADEDFVVATEAANALGKLKDDTATAALIEQFTLRQKRVDQDVRLGIMEAFVAMATVDAATIALDALDDSDKRLRQLAEAVLDTIQAEKPDLHDDRYFYERDYRRATIQTEYGNIEVELFGDDATQTAMNFIKLARTGRYDDLTFHRVVGNFVVQGGCPRGDGWGDQGYNIRSEFNQHHYERGFVGIAHAGKDTGGSQFFITHSPQPHLNGRYTIFGRVTSGMEVVDSIKQGDHFRVVLPE